MRPVRLLRQRTEMAHAVELSGVFRPVTMLTTAEPSNRESVAEAVRSVMRGDREAFTRVYAAYGRMVRAVLLGRVPRREVDDLLQDVFVTAFVRIRELREPSAFGAWVATIARNRATDHLRRSREH